jgi:hypothetical protein
MKYTILILLMVLVSFQTKAHPGVGIVEDSKGNVFYTDLKQVWKISIDGRKSVVVPNVHTHELYLDESDNLFGEHLWYNGDRNTWGHYVWKFNASGRIEKIIPDKEGFLENYSFVRDHFGRMYWADRRVPCQKVVRKNADNTQTTMEPHCFDNIRKIETTADGTIFLIDFQDVKRIDKNGKLTTLASKVANKNWTKSTAENQNSVMSIWVDKLGNLYTAVTSERVIKKFAADGKEEIVFKPSLPWTPSGGMIDKNGNLWVLECTITNDVRVEKIGPGNKTTSY